ncbi:radical SAM protein [Chloroflexota bacterium]
MDYSYELGPIRPPSEAYSLLIRATMNCPWNRCKFCSSYKKDKFQLRPVADIKKDIEIAKAIYDDVAKRALETGYGNRVKEVAGLILNSPHNQVVHNVALWIYSGAENIFLQDADSLIMRAGELVEVLHFIKEVFPTVKRITSYARSKTAAKKKPEELEALRKAGLSRLHIGLESGYDPILQFMDKGATAEAHIKGGRNIVESGISLSEYVLLGLGGKEMWREHAVETGRVLSEINPNFIRIRTLSVGKRTLLYDDVEAGNFTQLTDEEMMAEEKLLIENLHCTSAFVSDHVGNLLQEIEGKLPQDKNRMLAVIDRFQSLSPEERTNFVVGKRSGIYTFLDDMDKSYKHQVVEQIVDKQN